MSGMGWFQRLLGREAGTTGVLSPFATSHLEAVTWAHLFEAELATPVGRHQAMAIPAVARGRQTLTGQVGRLPLQAMRGDQPADPRRWLLLEQPEPWRPRALTLAWTVDACLFYGRAWWHVIERDYSDYPRWVEFVEEHRIGSDQLPGGQIVPTIDGERIQARDLLRIDGPHEGVLCFGQQTLRNARALATAATRAAANPVPSIDLHQESGDDLTDDEIDKLISRWAAARAGKNGGIGYTNRAIKANVLGQPVEQLLIAGRKQATLDVAQLLGLPAWAVDGEVSGSSLTYSNSPSRSRELLDYALQPYLDAIAGRLSLDDVLPRGTWAKFRTESLTSPEFSERMAGYKAAQEAGIYTAEECQAIERGTALENADAPALTDQETAA